MRQKFYLVKSFVAFLSWRFVFSYFFMWGIYFWCDSCYPCIIEEFELHIFSSRVTAKSACFSPARFIASTWKSGLQNIAVTRIRACYNLFLYQVLCNVTILFYTLLFFDRKVKWNYRIMFLESLRREHLRC